ncbi:transposase [Burkholderia cepacia]|uniref:transposase n=1 Tax=Burkholderia cepacia TaxID=292 RepID=UPI0018B05D69
MNIKTTPYFGAELSDEEWKYFSECFPDLAWTPRGQRGRPRRNPRVVLNGVLWVIGSGKPWAAIPRRYPSFQTCHRSFKRWRDDGSLERIVRMLQAIRGLELRSDIDYRVCPRGGRVNLNF